MVKLYWKPKRPVGRPPKNITILKMLWGGFPSVAAMREYEKKKSRKVI